MKKLLFVPFLVVFTMCLISCEKEEELSNEKAISSFSIASVDAVINENEKTVSLTLPYKTDVTTLEPTLTVSPAAKVSPASGVIQDFTSPVTYTVTAEDETTVDYTVTVTVLESENNAILEFSFDNLTQSVTGVVDEENKTISLQIPYDADITALVPTIAVSDDATVTPESGVKQDFSSTVTYTVTAQNGSEAEYEIMVTFEPSGEKAISEFKFEEFTPPLEGVIDEENKTINVTIPWNAEFSTDYDIYSMVPTILISEGATIYPASGESGNFNYDRTFTVTAENGDEQDYIVIVNNEDAPQATVDLPLTITEYSVGEFIEITGTNFTKDCQVVIGNMSTSTIITDITETSLKISVESYYFPVGDMNVKLSVREQEFDLGTVTILPPPPAFTELNKTTSDGNNILDIRGTNFLEENNEVYFVMDGNEEKAWIKSETETRIYVIIPPFIATGEYNIKVVADGRDGTSLETVNVTMSTETLPVITGVNKTTVAGGETLEIYGKNFTHFNDVGGSVSIGWMDGWAATKNIYGTIVSDEKIEVVIDRSKLTSDNKYTFYLDFGWPDTSVNNFYNIQITD